MCMNGMQLQLSIMQVPIIAHACRTSSDILLYPPVLLYCQMLVLHYITVPSSGSVVLVTHLTT